MAAYTTAVILRFLSDFDFISFGSIVSLETFVDIN